MRSDGKLLSLDNVWLSRQQTADKRGREYYLNLLDTNSAGRHELTLGQQVTGPQPAGTDFPIRRGEGYEVF